MEEENLKLQNELQENVRAKKEAEGKIQELYDLLTDVS